MVLVYRLELQVLLLALDTQVIKHKIHKSCGQSITLYTLSVYHFQREYLPAGRAVGAFLTVPVPFSETPELVPAPVPGTTPPGCPEMYKKGYSEFNTDTWRL